MQIILSFIISSISRAWFSLVASKYIRRLLMPQSIYYTHIIHKPNNIHMWMSFNKHIQEHDKLMHLIPSKLFILHSGFAKN